MNQFFEAFANMFRDSGPAQALLFTLAMLAVYRLGAFLPTRVSIPTFSRSSSTQNQGSF